MRGNAGSGPRESQFSQGSQDPGLAEALVVWGLVAVVGLCVLLTYSLVAPDELYNVSHGGLAGGAGRLLVFLNFPVALMAIAVLALVTDRLGIGWPSLLPLGLCLVILVPGVVDQDDLDAKWINVLPALGVAIVLAMTILAVRAGGVGGAGSARRRPRANRRRGGARLPRAAVDLRRGRALHRRRAGPGLDLPLEAGLRRARVRPSRRAPRLPGAPARRDGAPPAAGSSRG